MEIGSWIGEMQAIACIKWLYSCTKKKELSIYFKFTFWHQSCTNSINFEGQKIQKSTIYKF